jgi:KaiC/GvpD/RAD55 family RecA-like ATPase
MELQLVKTLLKKDSWESFKDHIDYPYLKDTCIELYYVYKVLALLHDKLAGDFTVDDLEAFFYATYPDVKKDIYAAVFEQIKASEVSDAVGQEVLKAMETKKKLLALSEAAFSASQGRVPQGAVDSDPIRNVLQIADSLTRPEEADSGEEVFITTDLEDLINEVVKQQGLRWPLDCLNKSLGSLRKGDFGFIFARPETGKTTFIASAVGRFLPQASRPIIWFNNEEEGRKVMLRVYQSYFGVTLQELLANVEYFKEKFTKEVGSNFLLVDDAAIEKGKVERICKKYNPSLIIFDQIDKIKGFKADRDDLVYGSIYQWARELAKMYAPTIGVCQADGTAEGQKWLTMGNVSNAKTSKQAEADWILGIGKTADEASEYVRYLNISKNKLVGDDDSIPELRHGRFEVLIQPDIARYKDVIKYE